MLHGREVWENRIGRSAGRDEERLQWRELSVVAVKNFVSI